MSLFALQRYNHTLISLIIHNDARISLFNWQQLICWFSQYDIGYLYSIEPLLIWNYQKIIKWIKIYIFIYLLNFLCIYFFILGGANDAYNVTSDLTHVGSIPSSIDVNLNEN